MRKVVVSEFLTLDGIMEAPNEWSFPYWADEIGKVKFDELVASDALLLGRVTYEGFAAAWPSMERDPQGFADKMNGIQKYVASKTLTKAEWNNSTIIKGNVADEVAKLKQQPGKDILVGGSANLIHALAQHDLIDEYTLLVYPIVWGKGKPLFQSSDKTAKLKLVESRSFNTGVVLLRYATERA